jgi:DNA-directed RNA polymerase specialized sigma subunit
MPASQAHQHPQRRQRLYLPKELRGRLPADDRAVDDAWHLYRETGDVHAFQRLCEFYAPLAFAVAWHRKNRRPDVYVDDLDTLVSDGIFGLMTWAIPAMAKRWGQIANVRAMIMCQVGRMIRRQVSSRAWGGRRRGERIAIVEQVNSRFYHEHGRTPTRAELHAGLREHFTNPNICVGDIHPPEISGHSADALEVADREAKPIGHEAMSRDALRLAMKGLKGEDKRILRLVLEGRGTRFIATSLGRSNDYTQRRINGLLWKLRCRHDLAAYLGVEPAEMPTPPQRDSGETPATAFRLPAVKSIGPARKVG